MYQGLYGTRPYLVVSLDVFKEYIPGGKAVFNILHCWADIEPTWIAEIIQSLLQIYGKTIMSITKIILGLIK